MTEPLLTINTQKTNIRKAAQAFESPGRSSVTPRKNTVVKIKERVAGQAPLGYNIRYKMREGKGC